MNVLVDTDCGVDDAQALVILLRAHELGNICLVGITCVAGNVPLDKVERNVCAVLDTCGGHAARGIPVFVGADRPLVAPLVTAEEWHGNDGLGDCDAAVSVDTTRVMRDEHAAEAIHRLAREWSVGGPRNGGGLTICTLGPLTNLALALRRGGDPALPAALARLVVMGGAYEARGNATLAAEYNIHADPESAAEVFAAPWKGGLTLATWELTQRCGLDSAFMNEWLRGHTPRSSFLRGVTRRLWDMSDMRDEAHHKMAQVKGTATSTLHSSAAAARASAGFLIPDPLAAALCVAPELAIDTVTRGIAVELSGALTRGQTVVDWGGRAISTAPPVVCIVERVDMNALRSLLLDSVVAHSPGGSEPGTAVAGKPE